MWPWLEAENSAFLLLPTWMHDLQTQRLLHSVPSVGRGNSSLSFQISPPMHHMPKITRPSQTNVLHIYFHKIMNSHLGIPFLVKPEPRKSNFLKFLLFKHIKFNLWEIWGSHTSDYDSILPFKMWCHIELVFYPEDYGRMFLQNAGNNQPVYQVSLPIRQ